jgi:hypothetical protein
MTMKQAKTALMRLLIPPSIPTTSRVVNDRSRSTSMKIQAKTALMRLLIPPSIPTTSRVVNDRSRSTSMKMPGETQRVRNRQSYAPMQTASFDLIIEPPKVVAARSEVQSFPPPGRAGSDIYLITQRLRI